MSAVVCSRTQWLLTCTTSRLHPVYTKHTPAHSAQCAPEKTSDRRSTAVFTSRDARIYRQGGSTRPWCRSSTGSRSACPVRVPSTRWPTAVCRLVLVQCTRYLYRIRTTKAAEQPCSSIIPHASTHLVHHLPALTSTNTPHCVSSLLLYLRDAAEAESTKGCRQYDSGSSGWLLLSEDRKQAALTHVSGG